MKKVFFTFVFILLAISLTFIYILNNSSANDFRIKEIKERSTSYSVLDDKFNLVEVELKNEINASSTNKLPENISNNKKLENIESSTSTLKKYPDNIFFEVPFTSQAPFADWTNDMFQDGCEEASILMAMRWVNSESLSKLEAEKEIVAMSEFEEEKYGDFRDSSIDDTAKIIKDYFKYENYKVVNNINSEDIINELKKGNLIIVPAAGRKLNNKYFTPPGPINHMLVVKGYDFETKEFITNDPGTRMGNSYRYSKNILEEAIRDYPSGYMEENLNINKNMIVVQPK